MENVIIFGGSGFIGSHIADVLTRRGYNVTIFDINTSRYLQSNQRMIIGDITNKDEVNRSMIGMDIVYNFAGKADIDDNDFDSIIKHNIFGNLNILNSCIYNKVKRYIFASTIYVNSRMGGIYKISKQTCENIIEEYNRLYKLPYTILRYGSVYGPRANYHNWIYKALKQALNEGKITRYGNGDEIREYIYVKDAAELSVDVLDNRYINKYIILTGNQSLKIKDLHIMIKEILNNEIELEYNGLDDKIDNHYNVTPYTFDIKPAMRLSSVTTHDMGQGIMECINEIYNEIKGNNI